MPQLLIANVNNENMMADRTGVTFEFACSTSITAMRHVWFAEPGDIVVLPESPSDEMMRYASEIRGFSFCDDVTFITPERGPSEIPILDFDCLHDEALISHLKGLMDKREDWTLLAYDFERSIASLARLLSIPLRGEAEAFRRSGGHELFNDKKAFRSLAAGRGIALSDGLVCSSPSELRAAFNCLIDETGAVIIKQSRHSSGCGNVIVSETRDIDGQGAPDVIFVGGRCPREKAADVTWKRLAGGLERYLIVEVYHPVRTVCYAEFELEANKRRLDLLNWGEQRMDPTFVGFEIPGAMPPYQAAKFISGATDLARLALDIGFFGLIDVDGIVTESGDVVFCEFNGRFAGCSHVHHLAAKLIGPNYGDNATILTRNKIAAPLFNDALQIMKAESLAFSRARGEGVVITGEDTARTGCLGYMAIGKSRKRALEIEARFNDCMALAANHQGLTEGSLSPEPVYH